MREAARALQLLRGKGDDSEAGLVSSRTETLSRADKRKRRKEEEEGEQRHMIDCHGCKCGTAKCQCSSRSCNASRSCMLD